ncbi:MAG: hypothetical protein H8D97_00795 [Proteobacteria bacterium]|nr:hypothetical protein [Pseudomonadota bacterium]
MSKNPKRKGNFNENLISKKLGEWIFKDKGALQRHQTSGAIKDLNYNGDIVPIKIEAINWKYFPFLIEVKIGYKSNIPNLNNQTIIRKWIDKANSEKTEKQYILWLIIRFHGYASLLITDIPVNHINAPLILNHNNIFYYIYNFEELLNNDFYKLYDNNEKLKNEVFEI